MCKPTLALVLVVAFGASSTTLEGTSAPATGSLADDACLLQSEVRAINTKARQAAAPPVRSASSEVATAVVKPNLPSEHASPLVGHAGELAEGQGYSAGGKAAVVAVRPRILDEPAHIFANHTRKSLTSEDAGAGDKGGSAALVEIVSHRASRETVESVPHKQGEDAMLPERTQKINQDELALLTEVAEASKALQQNEEDGDSTFKSLVLNEIEFELNLSGGTPPLKNKFVLALLEFLFLPAFCGVDRCYMGQTCLGVTKGLTFAGFGIWLLIDNIVVLVNSMTRSTSIDSLGFVAEFGADQITPAFIIACVWLGLIACACIFPACRACASISGLREKEAVSVTD